MSFLPPSCLSPALFVVLSCLADMCLLLASISFQLFLANPSQVFSYSVSHELTYHANHVGSIALIKRGPTIDTSRPLQTQVQFINLPGPAANDAGLGLASPYEALHSYIHYAVSPYFNAYVSTKGGSDTGASNKRPDDKDGKMGTVSLHLVACLLFPLFFFQLVLLLLTCFTPNGFSPR